MMLKTTKRRSDFIHKVTVALSEFMGDEIFESSGFSFFGKKKEAVALGSDQARGDDFHLVLRGVSTNGKAEDSPYEEELVEHDGEMQSVQKKSPWLYRVSYSAIGKDLSTHEGMEAAGAVHSFLFDHHEISSEYLERHNLAYLAPVHILPETGVSSHSMNGNSSKGSTLASFHLEFYFATGTALAVEKRVKKRSLQVGGMSSTQKSRE